jgi:hypothetical protein
LKFPANDLRAKEIAGARIAGEAERDAGIDIVGKLVMLFEDGSGNSVIPVRQDFLFPLEFAHVLSRGLASVGVGCGGEVVVIEQPRIAVDIVEDTLEAGILCQLIVQPRRRREVAIIIVDLPEALTPYMAYAERIAEFTQAASQGCDLTVGPFVAALRGYPTSIGPSSSFGE